MEAVTRKLVRQHIISQIASLCALGQEVPDEAAESLLGVSDVLPPVQECREFGPVVLVRNECIRLEHSFEPFRRVAHLVPDFGEVLKVAGDLTFVPGNQDRLDV